MSQVTITVDAQDYRVEEGSLLIEVLIQNGIKIPYFCYHEALGADGNCRMCMVEIEGQKRPQIACDTIVKEGMGVRTKGENINGVRQRILELELINHPVDCPVCDQAGECKLQDFYMDYGLYDSHIDMRQKIHGKKHVDLGSNVMLDQERCVLCARCTRFTADVTKTHELGIIGRGDHARVSTMPGRKLENPYAMNVVDLCPVGALTSKDFRFHQRVWFLKSTPSVCHGCAMGCNIFVDHNKAKYKEDTIYRFRPRRNDAVNGHFICDAGRLSYKALQENRQKEFELGGDSCTEQEALEAVKTAILEAQNITILIDANLYNEEIERIIVFASGIGATVLCPSDCYYDESFGDTWLKKPWRAANIEYINRTEIEHRLPEGSVDLLISFNHPSSKTVDSRLKIIFATHQGHKADILLPISLFSESSGSLTNIHGMTQHCEKAVEGEAPDLIRLVDMIEGEL